MTANDAAKIVADRDAVDPAQVEVAVGDWHRLIGATAQAGRRQAFERDLDRSRTPVKPQAHAAALDRLRADGYTVDRAADGEVLVSWPAAPATE